MEDCIFCKIANKETNEDFVYSSENFVVVMDIKPITKGHLLIIPKKHSTNILEMDSNLGNELIEIIHKMGKRVMDKLGADGFNVGVNTGETAGQIIMHTHIHLIPRYKGDGLVAWASTEYETEEEKKEIFEKLKED